MSFHSVKNKDKTLSLLKYLKSYYILQKVLDYLPQKIVKNMLLLLIIYNFYRKKKTLRFQGTGATISDKVFVFPRTSINGHVNI